MMFGSTFMLGFGLLAMVLVIGLLEFIKMATAFIAAVLGAGIGFPTICYLAAAWRRRWTLAASRASRCASCLRKASRTNQKIVRNRTTRAEPS
jgi:hypothetical protein